MKIQLTLEFASPQEAAAALQLLGHKGHTAQSIAQQAIELPETKQTESPALVAQEQPAPTAVAKTATVEEGRAAFTAHTQRANGNSARTAREAILKVVPHFQSMSALTPQELALAVDAMAAA